MAALVVAGLKVPPILAAAQGEDQPPQPVTLVAVGDVLLDAGLIRPTTRHGEQAAADDPASPFRYVADLLRQADLAFCNLEGPLSRRGARVEKMFTFRGRPESGALLAAAGIDVASVANNHTGDFGPRAFLDTLDALRAAGIQPVGGGRTLLDARLPVLFEVRGTTVAFLAYSHTYPIQFWATRSGPGVAPADPAQITRDIQSAKAQARVVVVSFHWGTELAEAPHDRQVALAHLAVDAGADLVLGHHPHVVQGLERYKQGVICYSLGNFIFPSKNPRAQETVMLRATIADGRLQDVELIPMRIYGYQPRPLADLERTALARRISDLCTVVGSTTAVTMDQTVLLRLP